ncbi:helix-turn-helix transcriptional regulator [Curtobacterium sp. MCBD17_021]|uniref:helix-turn-helix transcriptional regulator n=1 Tax=Curtobacterium sp. MCBD17_021 TaxID=2175665 RepID=UPI001C648866|nr:helix-turn-helix transcriptional regulator [Curtobacterium sp. MCBD17_021]
MSGSTATGPSEGVPDEPTVVPVRFEVAGTEPDAAVRDLAGIYEGKQWLSRRTEGEFSYRYTAVGDSELSMRRSTMSGFLRGASAPGDDLVMSWLTAGSGIPDTLRDRVPLRVGNPMLFPAHRDVVFVATDYDQQLVHLDRRFVRDVAAEHFDVGTRDLRFDHLRPPDAVAVRHWRDALGTLARALREGGTDSLVWHEAKRQTVDAFLRVVPPQLDRLPAELLHPRQAKLRAAVEHIHAHPEDPITIADLARVAGLSVRSVQESFRRTFGVSPLTYLRQVRLDRVHEELLARDPRTVSVGQVATRWGFAHLGRFSAAYAERFGEYPKQTLRR